MKKKVAYIFVAFLLFSACRLITPFTGSQEPSTATPTQTITSPPPSPTPAPPTATPSPTATSTSTPTPTATPTELPKPFAVLSGAPLYTQAFLHTDLGCAWMGVAGQVFALDGSPLTNLVVNVTGAIGDQSIEGMGYTGAAAGYGPGGYEVKLASQAAAGVFWIQVFDLDGRALTDPFNFETTGCCEQNLVMINFAQVHDYQLAQPAVNP